MRSRSACLVGSCLSAALLLSTKISAQVPAAGDRDPSGRIFAKVVVTMTEARSFGYPVQGLAFLVVDENGDRVGMRTDDAGVTGVWLKPGSYRFVTPDPVAWEGSAYTWDLVMPIRAGTGVISLSQTNATTVAPLPVTARSQAEPRRRTRPDDPGGFARRRPAEVDERGSHTEGFFLAPHLVGASLAVEDSDLDSGAGAGVAIGYGLSRVVALFANADVATMDIRDPALTGEYTLAQVDLGAKFSFRSSRRSAIPYLQLAATALAGGSTADGTDSFISGPGYTVGGGINYYFDPEFALDVGLSYSAGRFNNFRIDGTEFPIADLSTTGARFQFGITWFPFSRRN